ncbi:MAG: polysaccharide biosynthesis/export family protein [bacterium]
MIHAGVGIFLFLTSLLPNTLSAQEQAVGSRGQAPSFRVGPGDKLEVLVWRDDYLSREVVVQPDGFLSFPLIGDVAVSGLTIPEIRKEVARRIREFLPEAQVSIILKEINSYSVYVLGKVNKPGQYRLSRPVDVMQALALAESFSKFASPGDIRIIRKVGTVNQAIPFNYTEVEKGKTLEQNIELISGDVVVVP